MKTFSRKKITSLIRFIRLDNYSVVFWILLVLSITAVYISISTGKISKWDFYNPDALYLPMVYKDLFSNYSLLGWRTPPAPYFFPDMPLYLMISFLVGNFHLAIMLYGVVQSLLFILSVIFLSNAVFESKKSLHRLILLAGVVFFLFLATGRCPAFLPILQNGYHFGATLSLIIALLLAVQLLKCRADNKKAVVYVVLLFLLSLVMLLSDTLYLVQFLVPAMLSLLLLFVFSMISAKQAFFVYVALIPPVPLSIRLARFIFIFSDARRPHNPTIEETIGEISRAVKDILLWPENSWCSQKFLPFFRIIWIVFVLVSISLLVLSIKRVLTNKQGKIKAPGFLVAVILFALSILTTIVFMFTRQGEWIVWTIFVLVSISLLVLSAKESVILTTDKSAKDTKFILIVSFFIFCIITNVVATFSVGGSSPRYVLPIIILPVFFGWPFLIGGWKGLLTVMDNKYVIYGLAVGTIVLSLFLGTLSNFKYISSLIQLSDYYPAFIECLDRNTRFRNIRSGMTQYWRAKYITMLSKNNLHVVQVQQIGHGIFFDHWINNLNWYNADFEFVITDTVLGDIRSIYEPAIVERFGEPADAFSCENKKVLVYNRKGDGDFHKQFRKYFSFDFYASQLPSETGRIFGLSRIANEESHKKGYLTYGPYLDLLIGDYYFEIHYYAEKSNKGKYVGQWDILIHAPDEGIQVLKKGEIEEEGNNMISGIFKIRDIGKIEIRTHYKARGILRVDKIKVRRIR